MEADKMEFDEILTKFAESGWDVIEEPSRAWLEGSCGCEFDPLYKRALVLAQEIN